MRELGLVEAEIMETSRELADTVLEGAKLQEERASRIVISQQQILDGDRSFEKDNKDWTMRHRLNAMKQEELHHKTNRLMQERDYIKGVEIDADETATA